ncbi:LysR family transcriptional regulator [Paraburkholderia sp. C35]|uniref:winged helix-turn-helix domain-containing protein n=1 Tax=Paraburkholderia sp. C35 TaxID=2126993 RepID=UPI001EF45333|nr:LysR family transcriptional regulator [Paraburkholderia sp. C35]
MHSKIDVRFRLRILVGDTVAIGPGKMALLEAIQENGSISAAARSLGMSYRRAWVLLDELNSLLREPATSASTGGATGGGCQLTDVGEALVRLYRQINLEASQACAVHLAALRGLIS